MRRLLVLLVVARALWGAPGAFAAGWCGSGESAVDRPDATTGAQIHAIWVVPADSPDTFATGAPKMADDLASLSAWWVGQDPTRTPRIDTAVFPAGTCADISFVRLPQPASSFVGANNCVQTRSRPTWSRWASRTSSRSTSSTTTARPSRQTSAAPAPAASRRGRRSPMCGSPAVPDVPTDAIAAHELLHALGALPAGAPNACTAANNPLGPVADAGHPCDSPQDVLYPVTPPARRSAQLVLDVNHDDYYGALGNLGRHPGLGVAPPARRARDPARGRRSPARAWSRASCRASTARRRARRSGTAAPRPRCSPRPAHGKRFVGWTGDVHRAS